MIPQLMVKLSMYIIPILHLMIGLLNKVWASFCLFLDEFVETIGAIEAELRESVKYHEELLKDLIDKSDVHTVNKNIASAEIDLNPEVKEIFNMSLQKLKNLDKERKENYKLLKKQKTH